MKQSNAYNDEQLCAFLDGELDTAQAQAIKAALSENAVLQARLETLKLDKAKISQAFDALLDQAPKQMPANTAKTVKTSYWLQSVAAALVLSIGLVGGWLLHGTQGPAAMPWHQSVAEYQVLYISRTLNHINNSDLKKRAELSSVEAVIGKHFPIETLSARPELDYKRAQILGFKGQPLIQLAFLSKLDVPLALCVIKAENKLTENIKLASIEGMAAASWTQKGYAYLLIGGQDQRLIADQAEYFFTKL